MKSRVASVLVAAIAVAILFGCAPKVSTLYDVASNHEQAKQYQQAITKYDEYVKANTTSLLVPFALYHKGVCYEKLYDKPKAMEAYQTVLQQYPQTEPGQWAKAAMEDLAKRELTPPAPKAAPKSPTTTKAPTPTTTKAPAPAATPTTLKVVPK